VSTLFKFDVMLSRNEKDVDLFNLLKEFEKDVKKIPWNFVTTEYYPISDYLEKIFTVHINIYRMTDVEVETLLNFIHKHSNAQVKNLVLHKLIWKLRQSDTHSHQVIGQNVLNKHVFNIR
jgi:hypothetical protein